MPAGPAPTTATRSLARRDLGHDVRDAGRLVPLDEEPLHRPDRQRPVDVAAAAGPLARGGADVRAHRRDRVRLARQDVALFEPALGGEVEVAAAVGPDRAGFLALDVALEPGGVDGLDEEFLGRIDGQAGTCLSVVRCGLGRRRTIGRSPSAANLPSALVTPCKSARRVARRLRELTLRLSSQLRCQRSAPHGPTKELDPEHAGSVTASEFAFLALGLVLGAGRRRGALVEVLRGRPPAPREVRVTVAPDAIPRRRSATLVR